MPLSEFQVSGIGSSGNFLSAVERIKVELHRDREVEEDAIKRALSSAMDHYRWTRLGFNTSTATMSTAIGQREYTRETTPGSGDGFPHDLLDIDHLYIHQTPLNGQGVLSAQDRTLPMTRIHLSEFRFLDSGVSSGRPYCYSFSPRGKPQQQLGGLQGTLAIFPSPNNAYVIRFDYMADLPRPVYQFVGGDWSYFDSVSGDPIADDYSTPWLVFAEELIRNRAKADLWANVFYEDERAAISRGQETDALSELQKANDKMTSTGWVRGQFGGGAEPF